MLGALRSLGQSVQVNCEDVDKIRKLGSQDVLFVSKPELMRGFDYLSTRQEGIALLMARSLPSKRHVEQALGRVGRNGQQGTRYLLEALRDSKGVDSTQDLQQKAQLHASTGKGTPTPRRTAKATSDPPTAGAKRTRAQAQMTTPSTRTTRSAAKKPRQ